MEGGLSNQDKILTAEVFSFFKVLIFGSEILIIILACNQMDVLEDLDCIQIFEIVIDSIRSYAHFQYLKNGLNQRMFSPVQGN